MQSCRVLFPGFRLQMSVAKAGMLQQEEMPRRRNCALTMPLPAVPCLVPASAHEATGYPNLKLPGLSRPEQEKSHD